MCSVPPIFHSHQTFHLRSFYGTFYFAPLLSYTSIILEYRLISLNSWFNTLQTFFVYHFFSIAEGYDRIFPTVIISCLVLMELYNVLANLANILNKYTAFKRGDNLIFDWNIWNIIHIEYIQKGIFLLFISSSSNVRSFANLLNAQILYLERSF